MAVLFALGAFMPSTGHEAQQATLRVVDRSPLTVAGAAFHPRERLTLRVAASDHRAARTLTSTASGRFRATFAFSVSPCEGYLVSAVGRNGSRATLKVTGECPPPGEPGLYPADPLPKKP